VDKQGRIRERSVGEMISGEDPATGFEKAIVKLLAEG
jgi:hypothetical protein